MKCPTDGSTLVMSERSGIEIDYCPDCRGVWLDRGELDKILERATSDAAPAPAPPATEPPRQPQQHEGDRLRERFTDDYRGRDYRDRDQYGRPYRKKKKEHWLMEIFD